MTNKKYIPNRNIAYLCKFRLNLFLERARAHARHSVGSAEQPKQSQEKKKKKDNKETSQHWRIEPNISHKTNNTDMGTKFNAPMFSSNVKHADVECEHFKFDTM